MTYPATNPLHHMQADGRDYLTPEDIGHAIRAGGTKLEVWAVVLGAFAAGRDGIAYGCEDGPLCAFVALRGPADRPWAPDEPTPARWPPGTVLRLDCENLAHLHIVPAGEPVEVVKWTVEPREWSQVRIRGPAGVTYHLYAHLDCFKPESR